MTTLLNKNTPSTVLGSDILAVLALAENVRRLGYDGHGGADGGAGERGRGGKWRRDVGKLQKTAREGFSLPPFMGLTWASTSAHFKSEPIGPLMDFFLLLVLFKFKFGLAKNIF